MSDAADPDGEAFGPEDFVFGNELGEQVGSIKTAWRATCRRANIRDLHFHDLRREYGSLAEPRAARDVRDPKGPGNEIRFFDNGNMYWALIACRYVDLRLTISVSRRART